MRFSQFKVCIIMCEGLNLLENLYIKRGMPLMKDIKLSIILVNEILFLQSHQFYIRSVLRYQIPVN